MRKNLILMSIFLVMSLSSFWYLSTIHSSSLSKKEKQQALEKLLGYVPKLTAVPTSATHWKQYQGVAISFSYPTEARIYKTSQNDTLADIFSFGLSSPVLMITIQVQKNVGLLDFSAVKLRKTQSEYTSFLPKESCSGFIKNTVNVEKSIFCEKNGNVYSFVATGQDADAVSHYLDKVFSSASF